MGFRAKTSILAVSLTSILFLGVLPAFGEVDSKAEIILDMMDAARHPEGLDGYRCKARMITVEGNSDSTPALPFEFPNAPLEIEIDYIAPYDYRVNTLDFPFPPGMRLRGDDPLTLANPALEQALLAVYDATYGGTEIYSGEECQVLHFSPINTQIDSPPFDLYISLTGKLPLHTIIKLPTRGGEINFSTDIAYTEIDGFKVVASVTTKIKHSDWPELTTTTTFSEYEINPIETVLLDGNAKAVIETSDIDDEAFEDIYHGFEDPPIVIELGGDKPLYSKLRMAFALETSSEVAAKELKKSHSEIVTAIKDELTGRHWKDLNDRRFEVGRELMDVINDILTQGDVTDFYFTIFKPER